MSKKTEGKKEEKEINDALDELNEKSIRPDSFWKATGLFILEVTKIIVISLAIIIPIRYYLIQPFYVKGASMEPTFHDYEYLIIDEISYRLNDPHRGDIIVLKDPRNESQFFIKRIIGLPGETVTIKNGIVTITNTTYPSGIELDESIYLDEAIYTSGSIDVELDADKYYVMGDNRGSSLDSRIIGPIGEENIVGRAWIRAWPFNKLTHFNLPGYNI
ncbi:signal peptidase I [Patescibacteria group bacterium]|nr:signal peptidase I [Patescibacteria group bacterium]